MITVDQLVPRMIVHTFGVDHRIIRVDRTSNRIRTRRPENDGTCHWIGIDDIEFIKADTGDDGFDLLSSVIHRLNGLVDGHVEAWVSPTISWERSSPRPPG